MYVLLPRLALLALAIALAAPAGAQHALAQATRAVPSGVDQVLRLPGQALRDMQDVADPLTDATLRPVIDRARESRRLLRRHPDLLDRDPAGELVMKQRVLAIEPSADALARSLSAGFIEVERRNLEELGLQVVVLQAPARLDTRAAIALLRELDPAGSYEYDHLYLRSGLPTPAVAAPTVATASSSASPARVGLLDGGVDSAHPALAGTRTQAWGCDGRRLPDAHGTAVASLLMAGSGGTLFAADLWCGQPVGGASTALAQALAWMAREKVVVINVSLVGPDNALLRRAVNAMVERGHVLVAAVGNDGPAALPLYPAAYPGVIGVTAVDRRERPLPEAGRGQQVDFAAAGSQLRAAGPKGGWVTVRGTSFAAPHVAHLAASHVDGLRPGNADAVVRALGRDARDAGAPGRDDVFGLGILEN
jgi:subtilisin family serine protease